MTYTIFMIEGLAQSTLHPLSQELLTRSRGVEIPPELHSKRAEFETIYEKLPEIVQDLLAAYKEVLTMYKLDPGEVRLYLVGGRVKGKPLKEDSDLDLIFSVSNVKQSPGAVLLEGYDVLDSQDYKLMIMKQIMSRLKAICEAHGVSNHFHIIDYGTALPEHPVDTTQALLLGSLST